MFQRRIQNRVNHALPIVCNCVFGNLSKSTAPNIKFPLRVSTLNWTKFAGNCRFAHIC